ncbi:uncharacterized protein LOC141951124 [Strix uralensis]|uniref:uncharacterized protein LOC141951124 n=1 Tax=Strix uralensis TaxID=36305 RepID=UPI003DA719FC
MLVFAWVCLGRGFRSRWVCGARGCQPGSVPNSRNGSLADAMFLWSQFLLFAVSTDPAVPVLVTPVGGAALHVAGAQLCKGLGGVGPVWYMEKPDDVKTVFGSIARSFWERSPLLSGLLCPSPLSDATPPFVEPKTTEVHSLLGCVTTLLTASLQLQSHPVCRFLCCLSSYASPDVLGVSLLEESQASKDQTPLGVSMVLECRWPHNQPRLNRVILFSVDRGYFGSLRSVYAHTECFRWRPGGPAPLGAGPASKRDQVVQCRVPRGTPPRAGDPAADSLPARTLRRRQSLALSVRPPSSNKEVFVPALCLGCALDISWKPDSLTSLEVCEYNVSRLQLGLNQAFCRRCGGTM